MRANKDEVCLGDKFSRNGETYTVKSFPTELHIFADGRLEELDTYMFRDDKLVDDINRYIEDSR